jgi:NADH dehydrogenase FAD-containing subunit
LLSDHGEAGEMSKKPRVIIIGGRFGGRRAAQALKGAPADVTLIHQVATGSLSPGEIAALLRTSSPRTTRRIAGRVPETGR